MSVRLRRTLLCMLLSLSVSLPILFSINQFIVLSIKCYKIVQNIHDNLQEPNVMDSNCLFDPSYNLKTKDIQFALMCDKVTKSNSPILETGISGIWYFSLING